MNNALWIDLFQTPSARGLVSRVVDGLSNQISQLLLIPEIVECDVVYDAIRAEALRRDFSIGDICFTSGDCELTAFKFAQLVQSTSAKGSFNCGVLEEVLRTSGLPDLIFLNGTDQLCPTSRKRLVVILSQWSRISQNLLEQGEDCSTACCIAFATNELIRASQPELHLNVEWWWGFPSTLEAALLCRQWIGENGRDAKTIWREALATSLCPGDVTYIAEIWSVLTETHSSIWRTTREYGERLGWTRNHVQNVLRSLPSGLAGFPGSDGSATSEGAIPPVAYRIPWRTGMLLFSPESGIEFHPAAFALIGRIEALEQRLWRAQATLLLPRLDMVRHSICGRLAQRYGSDWATRWAQPKSDEELEQLKRSHFSCQWGYLEFLLRSCVCFLQV